MDGKLRISRITEEDYEKVSVLCLTEFTPIEETFAEYEVVGNSIVLEEAVELKAGCCYILEIPEVVPKPFYLTEPIQLQRVEK